MDVAEDVSMEVSTHSGSILAELQVFRPQLIEHKPLHLHIVYNIATFLACSLNTNRQGFHRQKSFSLRFHGSRQAST